MTCGHFCGRTSSITVNFTIKGLQVLVHEHLPYEIQRSGMVCVMAKLLMLRVPKVLFIFLLLFLRILFYFFSLVSLSVYISLQIFVLPNKTTYICFSLFLLVAINAHVGCIAYKSAHVLKDGRMERFGRPQLKKWIGKEILTV